MDYDEYDDGQEDMTIGCMAKIGKSRSFSSFLNNFSIENFIQTQINKTSDGEDDALSKRNGLRKISSTEEFRVVPSFIQCLGVSENFQNSSEQIARSNNESYSHAQDAYTIEELNMPNGDNPIPESDLSVPRTIYVVTTASLPWMTGTAVNPLLRAAYLKKANNQHDVTLVIPWLENLEDRRHLYGDENLFLGGMEEQEIFVRGWLRDKAKLEKEADPQNGIHIL